MNHLTSVQLKELKERLIEEQSQILADVLPQLDRLPLPEGEPRDLSDMATEDELRMLQNGLDRRQQGRLFEIACALVRLRDGVFGICEDSDEEIPFARLTLDPTVRRCTEAQQAYEDEQERARRVARGSGEQAY